MRPPTLRASYLRADELVVDLFAGGGGTSVGLEAALGRVDIAINHSPEAIAMHRANHPQTTHYQSDVWEVEPRAACGGRPVGLLWLSPDCTHFSRAKGGKPREKRTRSLAWVAVRWAREVRPRVIVLENVEEFEGWGPLTADDMPCPRRVGLTFRRWVGRLRALGYTVEWRSLVAADYGTPTTRRRLFLVARCDSQAIAWPEPTHGRGRTPWRTAVDVIDWSLPCPSIFGRARPLADATLRRIAEGVRRYVIECAEPFVMPVTHHDTSRRQRGIGQPLPTVIGAHRGELALVSPLVTKHYGGVVGHEISRPLGTVTAKDHHALTAAFLTKFYGTSIGVGVQQPLPTVTGGGQHIAAVRAFLVGYYSQGGSRQMSLLDPLRTITAKARFGLVSVHGEPYQIVDIGMRMLAPHELFAAQGFPRDYVIAPEFGGKPMTKTAQIALAGNSVCPQVAEAIVRAQFHRERRQVA